MISTMGPPWSSRDQASSGPSARPPERGCSQRSTRSSCSSGVLWRSQHVIDESSCSQLLQPTSDVVVPTTRRRSTAKVTSAANSTNGILLSPTCRCCGWHRRRHHGPHAPRTPGSSARPPSHTSVHIVCRHRLITLPPGLPSPHAGCCCRAPPAAKRGIMCSRRRSPPPPQLGRPLGGGYARRYSITREETLPATPLDHLLETNAGHDCFLSVLRGPGPYHVHRSSNEDR